MGTVAKPGSISFEDRVVKERPFEWGYGSTPRIAKIRDDICSKSAVIKDFVNMGSGEITFRNEVRIDMDRASIVTKAYKETEGHPMVIRRAKSFYKLCDEMPIFIRPLDLIVGSPNSAPDEVRWYPEADVSYMPQAITDGGYKHMLTEDEKTYLLDEIYEYWKDKTTDYLTRKVLPDDVKDFVDIGLFSTGGYANHWRSPRGLVNPDWTHLLDEGLSARIKRIEGYFAKHKEHFADGDDPAEYIKKCHNWEAMIIAGKAMIRFSERYAELAEEQAKTESDPARKKELEQIAETCRWVPANPPRTFREALQSYWIQEVAFRYLEAPNNGNGAHIDRIWWKYYKKDIEDDIMTRNQAIELIESWMLNVEEVGTHAEAPDIFTVASGGLVFYTTQIGGTINGKDACTDLTCAIAEALSNIRTSQPPLGFQYHSNISSDVVDRMIDLDRSGLGHPSWFNETLNKQYAMMIGHTPEDAEKSLVAGCLVPSIAGKSWNACAYVEVGLYSSMKSLELACWQGVDKMTGMKVGADTPDPHTFKDSDDFLKAICDQQEFMTRRYAKSNDIGFQVMIDYYQLPGASFVLDDTSIEGLDVNEMSRIHNSWPNFAGGEFATLADSLAAVQKLIFDEKKVTWDELLNALETNWEGKEELRQLFLQAPKYGNDDDYADDWAIKTHRDILKSMAKVKDAWGRSWTYDGSTGVSPMVLPQGIHATPDGRMIGEAGADSTLAPAPGRDVNGPTATMNSISKIPFIMNDLLNQRIMPQALEGAENKKIFRNYLNQWFNTGNTYHIQFNVVNNEILKDAKKHPEKHSDLLVRVAGYSAYFVDLPEVVQDHVMSRSEHCI